MSFDPDALAEYAQSLVDSRVSSSVVVLDAFTRRTSYAMATCRQEGDWLVVYSAWDGGVFAQWAPGKWIEATCAGVTYRPSVPVALHALDARRI